MKRVKFNYRQKTITALQDSGMTPQQATSFYNRIYSQALKVIDKSTRGNFNVARELYIYMNVEGYASSGKSVIEIDYEKNKVVLNELFKGAKDIGFEKTMFVMEDLYEKFKDSPALRRIFQDFRDGKISRSEFNTKIKEWKKLNIKYMISGSK